MYASDGVLYLDFWYTVNDFNKNEVVNIWKKTITTTAKLKSI